ncbi:hypothetical protein D3C72_2147840 [compost metagenome]
MGVAHRNIPMSVGSTAVEAHESSTFPGGKTARVFAWLNDQDFRAVLVIAST